VLLKPDDGMTNASIRAALQELMSIAFGRQYYGLLQGTLIFALIAECLVPLVKPHQIDASTDEIASVFCI
jgi:hypothetical protein